MPCCWGNNAGTAVISRRTFVSFSLSTDRKLLKPLPASHGFWHSWGECSSLLRQRESGALRSCTLAAPQWGCAHASYSMSAADTLLKMKGPRHLLCTDLKRYCSDKCRYWGWFSLIHAAVKGFIPALILLSCWFPFEFWSNTGEDKNMAWISIGICSVLRRSRYVWVAISRGVALSGVLGSKYVAKVGVGML